MELLTVQEAATLLKVSIRTIRKWVAEGKLPALRIGRTVRIPLNELVEKLKHN